MVDLGIRYRQQFQRQFVRFGAARFEVTYVSVGQSVYDKETGVVTPANDVTHPNFHMLWDQKSLQQVPGVVVEDDETGVLFPALDIPQRPSTDDYFTNLSTNQVYRVTGVFPDNFDASYILKVKRFNRG